MSPGGETPGEAIPAEADEPAGSWEGEGSESLKVRFGVPQVHLFRRVGSTNNVARRLGQGGAPAGTIVIAEEQLAGRGRAGRGWSSPPRLGLWLSLIARPREVREPGALPVLVGLRLAEALDAFLAPARVGLKWPNDLFIGDRKLGGILCEGFWTGATAGFIVIGVGVNVLHRPDDFPEDLRATATSLRAATGGSPPSRLAVATRVAYGLSQLLDVLPGLDDAALAAYNERHLLHGQLVAVTDPVTEEGSLRGEVVGIGGDGALLLRVDAGRLRAVRSGTVRLATNRSDGHELSNRG